MLRAATAHDQKFQKFSSATPSKGDNVGIQGITIGMSPDFERTASWKKLLWFWTNPRLYWKMSAVYWKNPVSPENTYGPITVS
jgi:hypothetical protein